jgi:hypothetical protein
MNDLLGTYATSATQGRVGLLKIDDSSYGTSDNSNLVTPAECVGIVFGAEHHIYASTGFEEMRDQTFKTEPYVYDPTNSAPYLVEQTVFVFPSADQAEAILTSAQTQRQACASGAVKEFVPPEDARVFMLVAFAPRRPAHGLYGVKRRRDRAHACQQVLGVRENVVVGARSCIISKGVTNPMAVEDPGWATDDAQRLAAAMLERVKA